MGASTSSLQAKLGKMFMELHIKLVDISSQNKEQVLECLNSAQQSCLKTNSGSAALYNVVNIEFPKIVNLLVPPRLLATSPMNQKIDDFNNLILEMTPLIIQLAQNIKNTNYALTNL